MDIRFVVGNAGDCEYDGIRGRAVLLDSEGNTLYDTGEINLDINPDQRSVDYTATLPDVVGTEQVYIGVYDLECAQPVEVYLNGTLVETFYNYLNNEWQSVYVQHRVQDPTQGIIAAVTPIVVLVMLGMMMMPMFKE